MISLSLVGQHPDQAGLSFNIYRVDNIDKERREKKEKMAETQNSTYIDQTDPRESFGIFAPENFAVALFFISSHSRFMVLFGIFFSALALTYLM